MFGTKKKNVDKKKWDFPLFSSHFPSSSLQAINTENNHTQKKKKKKMVQFSTDCDRSTPPECIQPDGSVWVFGYGSMLWKVTFPYASAESGSIKGYERRFCQGSADHRGTTEAPGRVVTLIPSEDSTLWGKVFKIAANDVDSVLDGLNEREKGGYITQAVKVTTEGGSVVAVMYSSTSESPNFISNEAIEDTAKVISSAVGPSGPNTEYLYNLNKSLRVLGHTDSYCEELEKHVLSYSK